MPVRLRDRLLFRLEKRRGFGFFAGMGIAGPGIAGLIWACAPALAGMPVAAPVVPDDTGAPVEIPAAGTIAQGDAASASPVEKSDRLLLYGGGLSGDSSFFYSGLIVPWSGDINGSGPVIRIWSGISAFDYTTTIGATANAKVSAVGYAIVVEAGYQWVLPDRVIALYAGPGLRSHTLSPADPGSDLNGNDLGFRLTFDGRTMVSRHYGIAGNFSYTFGFDDYWAQARPFRKFASGVRLGPEIVLLGGDEYDYQRIGAFASDITVRLPWLGRFFFSAEAGVQHDSGENKVSPYGAAHISLFY